MISKPLFRYGDHFTVAFDMKDENRILTAHDTTIAAVSDMQASGGETRLVTDIEDLSRYRDGGIIIYRLTGDSYAWSDEMSVEGQRLFRHLNLVSESEFNDYLYDLARRQLRG